MKTGCICGTFNRSFVTRTMDQVRGVELQDIHFPQTRPAYLKRMVEEG